MKLDIIGHASIAIKTRDCSIIMDPVLWDPHQEGLFDVEPRRAVLHDRLPRFDALIVSHKHLDHFDIRSLAFLPKSMTVFIPPDNLIEKSLRQLGYTKIRALNDFSEIRIGATKIYTTASDNKVPEFGVVISDDSGTVWNQVDTHISRSTIDRVLNRFPTVDFLLATWQPMMELNYQTNKNLTFPFAEYGSLVNNVALISPRAAAPGSNGFRYINESSWLNSVVFPVTRERFCHDVKQVCPDIGENVFAVDPGDVVRIEPRKITLAPGACEYVGKICEDLEGIDFSPEEVGATLIDHNKDRWNSQEMLSAITEEVEFNLPAFINSHKPMFQEHRRWRVIYQLKAVFPGMTLKWFFDFSEDPVVATAGRNPLANFCTSIAASSFFGIINGDRGWDHTILGGYFRSSKRVFSVTHLGMLMPENNLLKDPLLLRFPYNRIFENMIGLEIARWSSAFLAPESGNDASVLERPAIGE